MQTLATELLSTAVTVLVPMYGIVRLLKFLL